MTQRYPYHSCWVTDEQGLPNILGLAVLASVSADKSQISPFFLPMLANQSRYVGQSGLASAMPTRYSKYKVYLLQIQLNYE